LGVADMRVISGTAKGRRLLSVPGASTRPITDRAKEALFDILGRDVAGAQVLDLFAGTGSVGIEALSRGAAQAVFVERDRKALQVLRRNLELTGLAGRARVVGDDVFRFITQRVTTEGRPYDLVYVAPPQYQGLWERTLTALDETDLVSESGVVVVQIHPKEYRDLVLRHLALVDQRRYGSTMLCFYQLSDEGQTTKNEGGRRRMEG
jgi:16S rRNA (guanine(966)-N(2))-methyltransferase RsmD